jgi:hypothetical protein
VKAYFLAGLHSDCEWDAFACALVGQGGNEGVHLAEYVGFVGAKGVVVGVWDADDFSIGDLSLEGFGLAFDVAQVDCLHGGTDFWLVFIGVAEVVGVGEDGEDRNVLDGVVALHTFPDGEDRRGRSGGMAC